MGREKPIQPIRPNTPHAQPTVTDSPPPALTMAAHLVDALPLGRFRVGSAGQTRRPREVRGRAQRKSRNSRTWRLDSCIKRGCSRRGTKGFKTLAAGGSLAAAANTAAVERKQRERERENHGCRGFWRRCDFKQGAG